MFDSDGTGCIKTYCWFIYGQVLGLLRFRTCQGGFSGSNFPPEDFTFQAEVGHQMTFWISYKRRYGSPTFLCVLLAYNSEHWTNIKTWTRCPRLPWITALIKIILGSKGGDLIEHFAFKFGSNERMFLWSWEQAKHSSQFTVLIHRVHYRYRVL